MRTGRRFWLNKGFMPSESSAFKNITTEAIGDSRYIPIMIETRMRYKREASRQHLTIREYWQSIREMYVKRGFANRSSDLVLRGDANRRDKARRLAFAFFTAYKEKYGIRDRTGKLIETPRRKVKVKKRPITGKFNIDQAIRKDRDEIKYLRFRLKFERNDYMRNEYRTRIQRHQTRIAQLKAQAK